MLITKLVVSAVVLAVLCALSACGFRTDFFYYGQTGVRNVDYSPKLDGDTEYTKRAGEKY